MHTQQYFPLAMVHLDPEMKGNSGNSIYTLAKPKWQISTVYLLYSEEMIFSQHSVTNITDR